MASYLIVGAGRQTYGIVRDLLEYSGAERITVTDIDNKSLIKMHNKHQYSKDRLRFKNVPADSSEIEALIDDHDCVISAVPYEFNLNLTLLSIKHKKHYIDLGGNVDVVKSQFELSKKAEKAKVRVMPDCGLAPGLVSVVGQAAMDDVGGPDGVSLRMRVGGLPLRRINSLDYQISFSVHGLVNEYIEPCAVVRGGKLVWRPGMSDCESLSLSHPFEDMEAFNTSGGASTLPATYAEFATNIDYKTIRYPGHCYLMKSMLDMFTTTPEKRAVFENLLTKSLPTGMDDVILMKVNAERVVHGVLFTSEYECADYATDGLTAMMRMTAFPASITAQMLVNDEIEQFGVLKHEEVIPPKRMLDELDARGIKFRNTMDYKQ